MSQFERLVGEFTELQHALARVCDKAEQAKLERVRSELANQLREILPREQVEAELHMFEQQGQLSEWEEEYYDCLVFLLNEDFAQVGL